MVHVAVGLVIGVLARRLAPVGGQLGSSQKARLARRVLVGAHDQASRDRLVVRRDEPLAADRVFVGVAVRPVAVSQLPGHEIVLRKAIGFVAVCRLHFARVETAVGEPAVKVIAALARADIQVAADIVQAIARVVRAAHHFDVVDFEREDHVDEALVTAIDVARDAVDQHLDAIDIAFAVKGAKTRLARFGAHPRFGQLHTRQLADELPAIGHVLVFDLVRAQHVDRCQDAARAQGAGIALGADAHLAHDDCGIGSMGQRGTEGCQSKCMGNRKELECHQKDLVMDSASGNAC